MVLEDAVVAEAPFEFGVLIVHNFLALASAPRAGSSGHSAAGANKLYLKCCQLDWPLIRPISFGWIILLLPTSHARLKATCMVPMMVRRLRLIAADDSVAGWICDSGHSKLLFTRGTESYSTPSPSHIPLLTGIASSARGHSFDLGSSGPLFQERLD